MNRIEKSQIIARVDNESQAVVLVMMVKNFNLVDEESEPLEAAMIAAKNALQDVGAAVSASGSIVTLPKIQTDGDNAIRLDVSLTADN